MTDKKKANVPVIALVISIALAACGWLFGALQSANSQTHGTLTTNYDKLRVDVNEIKVDRTADHVILETVLENQREMKDDIKIIMQLLKR